MSVMLTDSSHVASKGPWSLIVLDVMQWLTTAKNSRCCWPSCHVPWTFSDIVSHTCGV